MTRRRKVIVTGTTGQLGNAIVHEKHDAWEILELNRRDVNLADWRTVRDYVARFQPDLVIHAAAMTDVDGCERDPHAAFLGNAVTSRYIARAAAQADAEIVYVSTNYVFDGQKSEPYHEFDTTHPISTYGASKLAGEVEILTATNRYYIVRTAWLYAPEGRNFVVTMQRLMRQRSDLTVVADQIGNPTLAGDLAQAIVGIVARAPYGHYHVTNTGEASWYEWSCEIARLTRASTRIEPIPGSEYQRAATPPPNGTMTSMLLPGIGITLPDWRDALRRALQ